MPLITINNLSLNIGHQSLLDKARLTVEAGERVCLLGRNGEGKSTLMRIISGQASADDGEVQCAPETRIAQLPQDVPEGTHGLVFDVVAAGLGRLGEVLAEYHHLITERPDDLNRLGELQSQIDAQDGWSMDSRVSAILTRLQLDEHTPFEDLSGGLKRRVLLAQALVREPDLLLLDEPTNHLDVDSISWLEEFLLGWSGTLLFVTHDRAFLRRLATRIIELDRGALTSWPGDYDEYLRRKQDALDTEGRARAEFDRKLAKEETWIRQGIQARRTRNEGRVRSLLQMRNELRERRNRLGTAKVVVQEAERSGKLVVEAEEVNFAWNDTPIIRGFSTTILRGDRIGIIGPNGAGKTTLLKLLLGQIEPQSGTIRHGTRLQVAYFDQLRATLDEDEMVCNSVVPGSEFIEINGARKHVLGYLQDFLFSPERARSPVRSLSGGERARLLLARLFTQPCNLLVLDEPTNDLDLETLDLLEERLADFGGTVFLVSHDRDFLNRVVTRSFALEGQGRISDTVGGYDDWLRQRRPASSAAKTAKSQANPSSTPPSSPSKNKAPKLSTAQRNELKKLPARLEKLESEQAQLATELSDPALFRDQAERARKLQGQLSAIKAEIAQAYARWEQLEALEAD